MATAGTTSSMTAVSLGEVTSSSTSPPTTCTPLRSPMESCEESSPWSEAVSEARREVRSPVRWPSKKATSWTMRARKSRCRTRFTPRSPARAKSQARPPTASPCRSASPAMSRAASRTRATSLGADGPVDDDADPLRVDQRRGRAEEEEERGAAEGPALLAEERPEAAAGRRCARCRSRARRRDHADRPAHKGPLGPPKSGPGAAASALGSGAVAAAARPASTWRTLVRSSAAVKGLGRKWIPAASTPWSPMASSV